MPAHQEHWIRTAYLNGATGPVAVGKMLVSNGTRYVVATAANRASYGRSACIALTAGDDDDTAVHGQFAGYVPNSATGLDAGTVTWVVVNADGDLERKATPVAGDDVVGKCNTRGDAWLQPGVWDADNYAGGGGGGGATLPIDLTTDVTGLLPIANLADGAADEVLTTNAAGNATQYRKIVDANVDAAAAIALSKTALSANAQTFLTTPSSANLRTLVSDETGTGALYFAGGDFAAATGTSAALSSYLSFTSSTPATSGDVRFGTSASIKGRTAGGTDYAFLAWTVGGQATFGGNAGTTIFLFNPATEIDFAVNGTTQAIVDSTGLKLGSSWRITLDVPSGSMSNHRTCSFPAMTGDDTFALVNFAQTLTNKTISGASNTLTVRLTADVTGTLPVGNGGTGITSLGSGVATWLGTASSANLATAVTDKTGSAGNLVFSTNPSLTGPSMSSPVVTGTPQYSGTRVTKKTVIAEVQTSSTTQTTCGSYTMTNETLCAFDVIVTMARRTNVTKGGRYKRSVVYRRTGGAAPTIVGTLESGTEQETTAADDITIDVSSNDVRVRVTAADSDNRNWTTEIYITEQAST